MPRIMTSLASKTLAMASPAEYQAERPSSERTSARVGRSTPNQGTYFFTTIQNVAPRSAANTIWEPAAPAIPSPAAIAPAVNAPPTISSAAWRPMRLYPRFIPRSTDSGSDARLANSSPPTSRATPSRTGACSSGGAWVIVGAAQTRTAPAARMTGRNRIQTTKAAPTYRRLAALSSLACMVATTRRNACVGRPSPAVR